MMVTYLKGKSVNPLSLIFLVEKNRDQSDGGRGITLEY